LKGSQTSLGIPCDVIKDRYEVAAFVGMDSATLQRACECFRPRIEAVKLMDISNNCALQRSRKCHVKGCFVIFNFSLKTFYLKIKEIVRFVRILMMHPICTYKNIHFPHFCFKEKVKDIIDIQQSFSKKLL